MRPVRGARVRVSGLGFPAWGWRNLDPHSNFMMARLTPSFPKTLTFQYQPLYPASPDSRTLTTSCTCHQLARKRESSAPDGICTTPECWRG